MKFCLALLALVACANAANLRQFSRELDEIMAGAFHTRRGAFEIGAGVGRGGRTSGRGGWGMWAGGASWEGDGKAGEVSLWQRLCFSSGAQTRPPGGAAMPAHTADDRAA